MEKIQEREAIKVIFLHDVGVGTTNIINILSGKVSNQILQRL